MSAEWVETLKVNDLKEQLKKRSLSATGVKSVLAARLLEALLQGTQVCVQFLFFNNKMHRPLHLIDGSSCVKPALILQF